MPFDYGPKVLSTKLKIRDKGRVVKLTKLDSASIDSSKPWSSSRKDRIADGNSVSVSAVSVPLSSASSLGIKHSQKDLLKMGVNSFYLAEVGEDDPEGLSDYHVIEDEDVEYKVNFVERLKPGNVTIMYYFGVGN